MNQAKIKLGKPNPQIAGIRMWIHGRQYPHLYDFWDGNWINVTAHCESCNTEVWIISDSVIHLPALQRLKDNLGVFKETLLGEVNLDYIEPNIRLHFLRKPTDSEKSPMIELKIEITPDLVNQGHWYLFELDCNELDSFINQLLTVLQQYPVRGQPDNKT